MTLAVNLPPSKYKRENMENITETIDNIRKDEGGIRIDPYLCKSGKLTIGVGWNLEANPPTKKDLELMKDCVSHGFGLADFFELKFDAFLSQLGAEIDNHGVNILQHPYDVQAIILNLAYNIGTARFNPKKWPNFFKALELRYYESAAVEMKYVSAKGNSLSKWYREGGSRSERLVNSMLKIAERESS